MFPGGIIVKVLFVQDRERARVAGKPREAAVSPGMPAKRLDHTIVLSKTPLFVEKTLITMPQG